MRRLLALLGITFPLLVLAYGTTNLPYSDAPRDRATAVAVSFLTDEGILEGYADGTFRPRQPVNRAEFLKVLMMGLQNALPQPSAACFPDVPANQWFAPAVCRAKALGLVEGNNLPGIPREQWRFLPARTVNYAEAVKMLVLGFAVPQTAMQSNEWYTPYITAAAREGLTLSGVAPGSLLNRGEVAQLVASFLAWSRGDLDAFRAAQRGESSSSSSQSSFSCRPYLCPDGAQFPSCTADGHVIYYIADPCLTHRGSSSSSSLSSSSSSSTSFAYDPGPDFSQTPAFIELGTTSPILGAVRIFNNDEPFTVDQITVSFVGPVESIDQVRLYATDDRRYLGGASRESSNSSSFTLRRAGGLLSVPRRDDVSVYARAVTRGYEQGGSSGEEVRIDDFTIEGRGDWSTDTYNQSSNETFQTFETARSIFTSITNAGPAEDVLLSGPGRTIGQWMFSGTRGDGSADLRVTDLAFSFGVSGNVALSNVTLGGDGSSDRMGCTMVGTTINCPSIPESIGSVQTGARQLTLRADITVPSSSQSAGLQVSLTPPGSASTPGAVTWTDGETSFTWIPFDESTLRGTFYRF